MLNTNQPFWMDISTLANETFSSGTCWKKIVRETLKDKKVYVGSYLQKWIKSCRFGYLWLIYIAFTTWREAKKKETPSWQLIRLIAPPQFVFWLLSHVCVPHTLCSLRVICSETKAEIIYGICRKCRWWVLLFELLKFLLRFEIKIRIFPLFSGLLR